MKYKSLIIHLYFGYTWKTKYVNLAIFIIPPSSPLFHLVIENLQSHLIVKFLILICSFWLNVSPKTKA
jgi:hypothetical protein